MIAITNLSKKYDKKIIFNGVSCSLSDRRVYALVGINGIGKSTLLNAITQSFSIDGGKIEIDGISSDLFQSKLHFFYVPDNKEMFLNLTGREYLQFVIKLYQQESKKSSLIIEELTCTFKLDQSLDDYIANYSLGMKQKIYLIAAFLSGARNLLLDEPFNGLDPESAAILKKMLIQSRDSGCMVLFSVHNLDLVANFCDEVLFITRDRKIISSVNPKNYALLENEFFHHCV